MTSGPRGSAPPDMKPVSYPSMPPSVAGGHPSLALDRVLSASNSMYCEKCGFATTDVAVYKKHIFEHLGTKFYCFYCYKVSFSEAELNAHLKEHTKYPFKCPHCGQGYMRRLCLVKHIERLHSKSVSQGPAKPGITRTPPLPVSSALPSVPAAAADLSALQPLVRVTPPTSSSPAVERKGKALDAGFPNSSNGSTELLSPLSGLIQHNRALTVSLPEEVTIPAGCLVELVEVKTVNGTKELKLRLVSQQENESVIKEARTSASQNPAQGKALSSRLINPSAFKSAHVGACTVSRKLCETPAAGAEKPPAVAPVGVSKGLSLHASAEKCGLKRRSPDVINLECQPRIPNKLQKSVLSPARERNAGITVAQREAANHSAASSAVLPSRLVSRLTGALHPESLGARACQKTADERSAFIAEHSSSVSLRKAGDLKSAPRDLSLAVKLEPGERHLKGAASKMNPGGLGASRQSLKPASPSLNVPLAAAAQARPSAISLCKEASSLPSYPPPGAARRALGHALSLKAPAASASNSGIPAWTQDLRSSKRAPEGDAVEPEGFPVISSVFSLSQQTEDAQGSIQPLVMALRGIVMDRDNGAGVKMAGRAEEAKEATTTASGGRAQAARQNGSLARERLPAERAGEAVKEETHSKGIQCPLSPKRDDVHVKEEEKSAPATDTAADVAARSHTPHSEPQTDEEPVSNCDSLAGAAASAAAAAAAAPADPLRQAAASELSIPSKFLTVSLKRVDEGMWRKSKKGLKLRISKCKNWTPLDPSGDCAVIHPMPLRVDQPVKRPGPNQPVVVLNHPKPRAAAPERDAVAETGAPEVVPKCQILKMRLSKVMGQKYEVMGCTVRVCP